jgi:hypothetical protein
LIHNGISLATLPPVVSSIHRSPTDLGRQRRIDGAEHLRGLQFVEAPAEAPDMPFAPLFLARKTGQWMLHQPDIFAALDRFGCFPHGSEPSSRNRPPEPRIGWPKQRDGGASGCRGEVSDRGIRADEEPGAGQHCGKLRPR